jgi:hypothetical protein
MNDETQKSLDRWKKYYTLKNNRPPTYGEQIEQLKKLKKREVRKNDKGNL